MGAATRPQHDLRFLLGATDAQALTNALVLCSSRQIRAINNTSYSCLFILPNCKNVNLLLRMQKLLSFLRRPSGSFRGDGCVYFTLNQPCAGKVDTPTLNALDRGLGTDTGYVVVEGCGKSIKNTRVPSFVTTDRACLCVVCVCSPFRNLRSCL